MNQIMVKPGFLKNGKQCKNCLKAILKNGNFCRRKEHSITRIIFVKSKERKNVEYNFAELLVAVCLKNPLCKTKQDIIDNKDSIFCKNIQGYIDDLNCRSTKIIDQYINFLTKQTIFNNVKDVYLLGKNSNSYPEITSLNRNLTQIDAKSDVMIKLVDNSWVGLSVKANKSCFLTNYSIQKILSNGTELDEIKKDYLKTNGFLKFNKEERIKVNKLFHRSNIYWDKLQESIEKEKCKIISILKEGLCSSKTTYNVFEIDGEDIIDLSLLQKELDSKKIDLIKREYPERNAAKIWYDILVDNIIKYKIEIRWKGNVFISPQIMIQKI